MFAVAQREMLVGGAGHVKTVGIGELRFIAVGRGVPNHHAVAGLDLAPMHLGILGGGAHEMSDRRGVAQDFLDRGGQQRSVFGQALALRGILNQREHPARGRVAGGFLTADNQQEAVEQDLHVGQFLTVHFAMDQRADQIAAGILAPLADDIDEVVEAGELGLAPRRHGVAIDLVFRIVGADRHVGHCEHHVPVRLGYSQHLADYGGRELGRDVDHEIALAAGRHRVQDFRRNRSDVRFQRRQRGLGETLVDDLAHPGVAGRIGRDQHLAKTRLLRHRFFVAQAVIERDSAALGTKRIRIAVNAQRVLVPGD